METFFHLTAGELMTRDLVLLPRNMPLPHAVRLLLHDGITGAPVVDADGKCLGVLSLTDIALAAAKWKPTKATASSLNASARPLTCTFLVKHASDGEEFFCKLPSGLCHFQLKQEGTEGENMLMCTQPHSVLMDWQLMHMEKLPVGEVGQFMTPDPVTVKPDTPIRAFARHMIDAKVHRVIVVDEENHPIGIVTSTDIVAAVAYSDDES
jgi:CBS domain-containing protein